MNGTSTGKAAREASSRLKVIVFGLFGSGNLGNEATLHAMLYNLRKYMQEAEFRCACSGPAETSAAHKILSFPIREGRFPETKNALVRRLARLVFALPIELFRWFKVISRLRGSDVLVMTGTGMLMDLGHSPLGLPYDVWRWSAAAKLCRCKLLYVSVGVGPIRHPLSRFFITHAMGLAEYRSYRDASSCSYMERIGFAKNGDKIFPDLAYSLPRAMLPLSADYRAQRPVVGFGLITHSIRRATARNDEMLYQDYLGKVARFVRWLVEHGYKVRLLIGDVAYDERARLDLRALLERDGCKYEGAQILDEPAHSVDELLSQIVATDVVIASRFHNVLLALMLDKPVVAISFHEKVESLMSAMGLADFCQDIEDINLEKLKKQFTAAKRNAQPLKLQIQRKTEDYRRALERQYENLVQVSGIHGLAAH